jgi:hypothetical protein
MRGFDTVMFWLPAYVHDLTNVQLHFPHAARPAAAAKPAGKRQPDITRSISSVRFLAIVFTSALSW